MKRAQTEIIGLVFVVIIGIFGLVLYVALSSSIESTDNLREEQLALSMLTTMVQVDVGDIKYSDLVASYITRNVGLDDLDYATTQMLNQLNELNQPYMFVILNEEGIQEYGPIYYECDEDSDRPAANEQAIPLFGSSRHVTLVLSLCK